MLVVVVGVPTTTPPLVDVVVVYVVVAYRIFCPGPVVLRQTTVDPPFVGEGQVLPAGRYVTVVRLVDVVLQV